VSMLLEQLPEKLRLRYRPRKTVKHKSVRTIRPLDAFRDHLQDDRVRHQVAALHHRFGRAAKRCALADMLAKHVAGRKVRDAVLLRQLFRLGALSRSRRTEKN